MRKRDSACPACGNPCMRICMGPSATAPLWCDAPWAFMICGKCAHLYASEYGSMMRHDLTPAEREWLLENPERERVCRKIQQEVAEENHLIG